MEWLCVAYCFACICLNIYCIITHFFRPFMFIVTINNQCYSVVNFAYLIIQFYARSIRRNNPCETSTRVVYV